MKPSEITPEMVQFLRERHLATLTTLRKTDHRMLLRLVSVTTSSNSALA